MNEPHRILPEDPFNRELENNVHPPGWNNPEPAPRYNLVVIGAGTAGLVCAAGAAGLGARVALIERHLMGGDCLNVGCVPSKSLIRSARAAADVRDAENFGIHVPGGYDVDFSAVMKRVRRVRAGISPNDSAIRFSNDLGVDVFFGDGCFRGPRAVQVGGAVLRFRKAVIATGARAIEPPVEGLSEAGFLTNETVFSLTKLPSRLAVIGGGPLGCELAQAFGRLGCNVSLLHRGPRIMAREDADAARIIEGSLRKDGVKLFLSCGVRRVEKTDAGKIVHLETGSEKEQITVDEILIGAGRVPNVSGLGLEAAKVKYDGKAGVKVDEYLRTSNPSIFAAGDICSPYRFTHTADAQARIVIQNALFWGRKRSSTLTVPWCTYTDPEIAHVGMYEEDAREKGIPFQTFTVPMSDVDRAVTDGETDGMVRIHVRKGGGRILGATIVAHHAGEMISEISTAMGAKMGLGSLSGVIHPYPTQAEAIRKAADAYNRTRLTPGIKRFFETVLKWQRRR
jgi:pyruvate/2-oxoglutarate dehydrogenase complex dihydrolipoamide dehydrogenase (E3) component